MNITEIITIGSALGALGAFNLARNVYKESKDVVQEVIKSISPDSEGGKEVTPKEAEKIAKETLDAYKAGYKFYGVIKKVFKIGKNSK